MRMIIIAFLFATSSVALSLPTKDVKSARALLLLQKKRDRRTFWKKGMLPIPFISMIFTGSRTGKHYHESSKLYDYFSAAHILKHKSHNRKLEVERAEKDLDELLRKIKEKVKTEVETNPETMLKKGQKSLTEKIQSMRLKDLRRLINKADKVIPQIIGDAENYFANHDLDNFIYSIYTVNNPKKKKPESILEASIRKELTFMASRLRDQETL